MRSPIPSDDCARACEWASLRLDGQLSEFEEVLLEAHLARCPDCHAFASSISGLTGALRGAPLEEPAFAFEPPRRTSGRTFALRAVSAAAAIAVVGVSGLVSLQVSTSRARPGAQAAERKVIGLKERQMNELTGPTTRPQTQVRQSLAAAEQVIVGEQPPAAARSNLREVSPND
jgi:ferric-dicitrate binding protein FerR (iron transport regulator)